MWHVSSGPYFPSVIACCRRAVSWDAGQKMASFFRSAVLFCAARPWRGYSYQGPVGRVTLATRMVSDSSSVTNNNKAMNLREFSVCRPSYSSEVLENVSKHAKYVLDIFNFVPRVFPSKLGTRLRHFLSREKNRVRMDMGTLNEAVKELEHLLSWHGEVFVHGDMCNCTNYIPRIWRFAAGIWKMISR